MHRFILYLVIGTLIVPAAFAKAIPGSNRDLRNQVPGQPFGTPGPYGGGYEPSGCSATCAGIDGNGDSCYRDGLHANCFCDGQGRAICEIRLIDSALQTLAVIYADDEDVVHTAARIDSLILEVGALVASPPLAADLEQSFADLRDALLARSNASYATALASHEGVLEQLPPEEVVAVYDAVYYGMFTDE